MIPTATILTVISYCLHAIKDRFRDIPIRVLWHPVNIRCTIFSGCNHVEKLSNYLL